MKTALLASFLMLQVMPPAQEGTVTGVVRDRDGILPGAIVTLTRMGPETKTEVRTDAFGRFQVALPEAYYDMAVTMTGFRPAKATVRVLAGRTFTANMNLRIGTYNVALTINPVPGGSAPPMPADMRANPTTVSEMLDTARWQYEQGRLADAQTMTARALELMRTQPPAPPPAQSGAIAVRVGGFIVEPHSIVAMPPIYPTDALSARQNGVVVVDAVIGTDGFVRDIRIVQGAPLLDAAVVATVARWQYTPAMLNGKPTEVPLTVSVTFLPQ